MIRLSFTRGSSLRKVSIKGKKISFISQETNFEPLVIDLDKLESSDVFSKMDKKEKVFMKDVSKLKTEGDRAKDIITDFQRSGWRCIQRV